MMRKKVLIFLTAVALGAVPGAAQDPVPPATPAGCVKAVRDYALTQQRALARVTAESVRKIETDKVAMAQSCAARFDAATIAETELPGLIALYAEANQPERASAALTRALASRTLPAAARGDVLAQAVLSGLREPKSDARNARLETYVDQLDRLSDDLLDLKISTHARMNGYYRADDIDDGIIKHSTWLIDRAAGFTPAQRTTYGSTIVSAYINMAEALFGRGQNDRAHALLTAARSGWSDIRNASRMLDPVIARYALLGTIGTPISASRWLNAPPGTTLPMPGAVTILEFTAHWCVPCKESYPGLKRLLAKYGPRGLRVVLATELYGYFGTERPLTPDEEFARDRDYWAHEGLAVPIAVADPDSPNDKAYEVGGIPQIHVLDRHGRIRLIMVGYDDANEAGLSALIEKLLKEKE